MAVVGLRFCARAFSSCGKWGHSSSRYTDLSLSRPLLLRSTGFRRAGSVIVAHGPSRSAACGIFPDQGSNPCPLHWQADSQPLRHQGSPNMTFLRGWLIQTTPSESKSGIFTLWKEETQGMIGEMIWFEAVAAPGRLALVVLTGSISNWKEKLLLL